jgi:hypothetical protein
MKTFRNTFGLSLVILIFAILIFVSPIAAQGKKTLEPPAQNATLVETQNWLVNALEKNNDLKDLTGNGGTDVRYKVRSIVFSGCQMSFSRSTTLSTSSSEIRGGLGSAYIPYGGGPKNNPDTADYLRGEQTSMQSFNREVSLDFRLRNPDVLKVITHSSHLIDIVLDLRDPAAPAVGKNIPINSVYVRKADAPAIIAGFKQVADLCSSKK